MAKRGKEILLPQVPRQIVETGLDLCFNDQGEQSLKNIAEEMERNNPDFLQGSLRGSLWTMGSLSVIHGAMGARGFFSGAAFVAFCVDSETKRRQGIQPQYTNGAELDDNGFSVFKSIMRTQTVDAGDGRLGRRIEKENPYINYALGSLAFASLVKNPEAAWLVNPFIAGALYAYEDYRKPGRKDSPTKKEIPSAVPLVEPSIARRVLTEAILSPDQFIEDATADLRSMDPALAEGMAEIVEDPHTGKDASFALQISSSFVIRSLVEQAKKTGQKLPEKRKLLTFGHGIRLDMNNEGIEGVMNLPVKMVAENPHLAALARDFVSCFKKTEKEEGLVLMGAYVVYRDLRSLFVD